MRLIDADNLKKDLDAEIIFDSRDRYRIRDLIDIQMTIEAEPVRRGRWIVRDNPCTNWYKVACSKCGYGGVMTWNYCTHCGARMDGGQK